MSIGDVAFQIGRTYSARDIADVVGGELQTYLPQREGQIVAGRFNKQMNPEAPDRVYPAKLPKVLEKAELLVQQDSAVPVFMKERKSDKGFKYVGRYRAKALRRDQASIEAAKRRSGRDDLAGVLELERAGD